MTSLGGLKAFPSATTLLIPLLAGACAQAAVTTATPTPVATPTPPTCEDWAQEGFFISASADLVRECLQAGANPQEVIFTAAGGATDPGVIRVLVDFGANLNATRNRSYDSSRTPLHAAAEWHQDPAMIEVLVAAGADINVRNREGETPLHHAWTNINPAVFRTLLRLGADPLARDERGRIADPTNCANWNTAAFTLLASRAEFEECVQTGESVNARDSGGYAPLHWAAATSHPPLLTTLLEAGADVNAQSNIGATPLHVAAITKSAGAVTLLLDAGADPNARDAEGRTPGDYAKVIESRVLTGVPELRRLLVAMRLLRFRRDPAP